MKTLSLSAAAAALLASAALGQVTIPPHASVYNGFSRGFNFVANTNFLINQLDLPLDAFQAGDTASYMVRINGIEVLRSVGNAGAISTSLLVFPGDVVDVIGNWSPAATTNFTAHNSYGNGAPYATTILGVAHTLNRTGWQWDIGDPSYMSGGYLAPGSGQLGRVFMYAVPQTGLFPSFTADVLVGPSPLTVNFTDTTYTSDPGGVTSWAWDVDNDGTTDYTTQNCTHTYNTGGKFSVKLTVTDVMHGTQFLTKIDYIVVDPITADFTASPTLGTAPLTVSFTDTSSGNPIAWQWDFDNDGTPDSFVQNPSHTYTTAGRYSVALSVTNGANQDSIVKTDLITVVGATNNTASAGILEFQFNEPRGVTVNNTASTTLAPATAVVGQGNGTPAASPWQADPGRPLFQGNEPGFGCLNADNTSPYEGVIDTGWPIDIVGSHTVMFWSNLVNTLSTCYPFGSGSGGSARCYWTSSVVGFQLRDWGTLTGSANYVTSGTNPSTVTGWNHWAVVIDDTAGTAQWYLNGVADGSPTLFTPGTFTFTGGNFKIGSYSTLTTSGYTRYAQMDDFRLYGSALTPAEIMTAMGSEHPTTGTFGDGCSGPVTTPTIGASGGAPAIGNAAFTIELRGMEAGVPQALNIAAFVVGGGLLPFDLGSVLPTFTGCFAELFPDVSVGLAGTASASVPVAIPAIPALAGAHAYAQAIVLGSVGAVSPALDINIQ
ncbi:MAG: PKD domain-containing protein [Planctomycetes bacterium]|nr:PKD domain-containing protein [Planctomycetota bacterium]